MQSGRKQTIFAIIRNRYDVDFVFAQ